MRTERLIREWETIISKAVERGEAAGVGLLCIRDGEEVCWIGRGYADRERERKIGRDTIFRLYSMTKPVTAAAAMILIEEGRLKPDASVGDYLPEFRCPKVWCGDNLIPAKRPVRISDLLSMTSGLSYGDHDTVTENATRKLFREIEESLFTEHPMTTREVAARAGGIPLLFQPGTSWKYGISADILGAVIEEAAGMSFGEFLRKRIFEPLGMEDTGFYVPEHKRERLAKAYERDSDGRNLPYTGNFLGIRNQMDRKAAYESGGAGLVSTAEDYARFAGMLLKKGEYQGMRILKEASVEQMLGGVLTACQQEAFENWFGQKGYDYGFLMRRLREPSSASMPGLKGEYCWDGWLGCSFWNYPKENMTLILMQQQLNGGDMVFQIKNAFVQQMR